MKAIPTLVFAAALFALTGFAENKPDFNGTWRLNQAESMYPNKDAVPTKLLKIVELKNDSLHYIVERELNGKSARMDLHLIMGETDPDTNVTAHWEGRTLVVEMISADGVRQIEHWTLGASGKRLTDNTIVQQPGRPNAAIVRVYDKIGLASHPPPAMEFSTNFQRRMTSNGSFN